MKNIFAIILSLLIMMFAGCTEESPTVPENDLIVVRGYIYAGEPIDDIQLTSTLPLDSEATKAPPINEAHVVLIKNGTSYELTLSEGDSGYYHYAGVDLTAEVDDQFTIQVSYDEQQVYGSTVVPEAPQNVSISKTTLILPGYDEIRELRLQGVSMDSIRQTMTLTVSWEAEEDALYYVHVENTEENPVPVESEFGDRAKTFISEPIAGGEYTINAMVMTHLGRHRVNVYRINQEYADLYQSRDQDSRDLNEPLTNIINGLGVFSAFNSDSVFFDFKQN